MKEMLVQTARIYGKRNAISKRKGFLALFSEQIRRLGFNVRIDEGYTSIHKYSAVYGDPKDAKAVFITGYDTTTAAILPGHKYYPANIRKSAAANLIDIYLRAALGALILFGAYQLMKLPVFSSSNILRYGTIVVLTVLVFFLLRGIDCKYSFNRNTSAVTLLYKTAEELKGNKKYSFVFADDTARSPVGYKRCADILKDDVANKDVFILEAVGAGEKMYLVHRDVQDEEAKRILSSFKDVEIEDVSLSEEKAEGTILRYFPKTFILTSGTMKNGEIECKETRSYSSLKCDIDRLEALEKGIVSFIDK